jgi:hypothetical protein
VSRRSRRNLCFESISRTGITNKPKGCHWLAVTWVYSRFSCFCCMCFCAWWYSKKNTTNLNMIRVFPPQIFVTSHYLIPGWRFK